MSNSDASAARISVVKEYFRLLDVHSPDLLGLFTDDFDFYYPKYGRGRGAAQLMEVVAGLARRVARSEHDPDSYLYVASCNHVVAEGTTRGELTNGEHWAAGETPCGRFCNVFGFRDGKIARLFIYLDPDYGNEAESAFLWGKEGRQW